ncbi:MAG: (E)-4-hydroxy-3-methylbut-2-enyl-diphosphate synthase [Nitrospinae bacterium]|nr:(E)-4-hydroxy-3-methylbut-2-enyl-diphosphate synthase [Nitrospinota bacterium]
MTSVPPYCGSPYHYHRRKTRVVCVGDVPLGGTYPIRVQSMTTPDTCDTEATVKQIIRLVEANCEIVRVTAPSIRDAENLREIKVALKRHGIQVPLVADIHFTPNAALLAADYVEKVRINPGNYADRKLFQIKEYTDNAYEAELERLEKAFKPLVLKCKHNGVAMRIGTNHGSLSDRIMNRYGDTPLGMVESALEFVRICETYGFRDIVLSMKASNPQVMIQAYRLLAARMDELGMDYPFHLGVTEAGDGEDGRIKSAVGTGTLLDDGIGDTVRVSLTEDPVAEVPVCYALVKPYNDRLSPGALREPPLPEPRPERIELRVSDRPTDALDVPEARHPYAYARRPTRVVDVGGIRLGGSYPVRVELAPHTSLTHIGELVSELEGLVRPARWEQSPYEIIQLRVANEDDLEACIAVAQALRTRGLTAPLAINVRAGREPPLPRAGLTRLLPHAAKLNVNPVATPDVASWGHTLDDLIDAAKATGIPIQWDLSPQSIPAHLPLPPIPTFPHGGGKGRLPIPVSPGEGWGKGERDRTLAGLGETALALARLCQDRIFEAYLMAIEDAPAIPAYRLLAGRLAAEGFDVPFTLKTPRLPADDALLQASLILGSLLCDGFGDAIEVVSDLPAADALRLSYNILQGSRRRISKTEFISCPSCGRTQFDLETTTQRIKAQTSHLRGVKIAIMGCIVNGPGEMADADFGYVGAGPGNINLYVGKECVERHIPFHLADQKLIELIKTHGKWVDP